MYQAVRHVLNEHGTAINGIPAMLSAANTFNAKLTELETLTLEKQNVNHGVKATRDVIRTRLEVKAFNLSKALSALAASSDNEVLREQSNFNRSFFKYASINDLLMAANKIWENANDHAVELEAFGVTSSLIDDLGIVILDFQAVASTPRTTIVRKKTISAEIKMLIREIDVVLKTQLDNIIVLLRLSAPRFVSDYKGARVIIDLKSKGKTSSENQGLDKELGAGELDISPPAGGDDG